jgi:large repetitive protein
MAIGITCATPPQADIGAAYSHAFPATGDTPPDVFDITVGTLPAGLTVAAATGVVSGTPTGPAGTSNFTIRVTDSTTATASVACSITVNGQLVITGPAPDGYLNVPYSHAFPAMGGVLPYVFSMQVGALPNGLRLNTATGVVSGIPLVQGLFNFTIRVTDALGSTSDLAIGLSIRPTAEARGGGASSGDCSCC